MNYIDLTRTFVHDMPVYPGDSPAELIQVAFEKKDGYNSFRVSTGMHVGTHMDAPLHMIANGKKLLSFPVSHFIGKGHLIDARDKEITSDLLKGKNIKSGDILLIMNGFDKKFNTEPYYNAYPAIQPSFAKKAVDLGVKIIGMDTPSPDYHPYEIHKILLGNDTLIVENLIDLDQLLPYSEFQVIALPAKFDAAAAPVRVIAQVFD